MKILYKAHNNNKQAVYTITFNFLPEYSIMKLAILSLTLGAASAFAPSASRTSITSLSMSEGGEEG